MKVRKCKCRRMPCSTGESGRYMGGYMKECRQFYVVIPFTIALLDAEYNGWRNMRHVHE
jgi:hypothetical protein